MVISAKLAMCKFNKKESKKKGIVSLILGILATVFGIFCLVPGISYYGWIGIVLGVAGIVLAALANKKEKKGINTAGLVLSIIGTVLCAILFIACVACHTALVSA